MDDTKATARDGERPSGSVAPATCFRDQLRFLEETGQLVRIAKSVNPRFEIAAVAKRLDPGPALQFDHVDGYSMPIALGTDGDRERISSSLGVRPLELVDRYLEAISRPLPEVIVSDGPVQEVIKMAPLDIMAELPVMTHYELDGGPYITSGILIAEDATRGVRNMSYHRLQVTGPDELRALIFPRHLRQLLEAAEAKNESLPVAIVLGMDSAQRLAAATWGSAIPLGLSELAISGALKGRPEPLVKCVTCDVYVPAEAEIVIEGEILPHVREPEGPFAEFTGNYGQLGKNPVIKVHAITRRHDAIYQGLLAFSSEHHNLLGLPYEPVVLKVLRGMLPNTEAVHITAGGCGKFHAIVRIKKRHEGDGKDAIIAALYAIRDIKLVIVVDDDVDPFNPRDVEWAVATRFQAGKDLVVISGGRGNELDQSTGGTGITSKMGMDATKPLVGRERFEKVQVPGADTLQLDMYLKGV
jgi:2,5-furandicarboxylate decarboxylase 1